MNEFKLVVVSSPDRENLVAEIWLKNDLLAEISHETDTWKLNLYPVPHFSMELDDFLQQFEIAKKKLM
jgi:hypothetical protein